MATRKQSDDGGDSTRSKVVGVRLDPRLRYLAELAARKQRRTLSSFIEWAMEQSLRQIELRHGSGFNGDESLTLEDEARRLWDVDEAERLVRLAILYPELLTHQEQEQWKLLRDSFLLTPAHSRVGGHLSWDWAILEDQVFPMIRRHWPALIAAYEKGTDASRKWVEQIQDQVTRGSIYPEKGESKTNTGFDDLDDDIPF